jgi:hypothetical protein
MRELAAKGQGIKFSGVSTQFQNGAVENGNQDCCPNGTYHDGPRCAPMAGVCQKGPLANGIDACGPSLEPNAENAEWRGAGGSIHTDSVEL